MVIDGKKIANEILEQLKQQTKPTKSLVALLIGAHPASVSFLKQKQKTAKTLGVDFKILEFSETISESALLVEIKKLNTDSEIGGIIAQLPLPGSLGRDRIINALDPQKDVDNLKGVNLVGAPAVGVVKEVLKSAGFFLKNKNVVIVGRGLLVGEPVAEWLKSEPVNLILMNSQSFNEAILKKADLIVSGVGTHGLITGVMIKNGVGLIDFGYSNVNGKLRGDFDFDSCAPKAVFITSTPGGTGPILVAKLFENFYHLTARQSNL